MINKNKKIEIHQLIFNAILLAFAALCIIPIIAVVSISLSNEAEIARSGYKLIPTEFSTLAYEIIFKNPDQIGRSYFVSIFVTLIGTIVSLILTSFVAYPLSRVDFKYRKGMTFYIFFTMLFNGGLVPQYILITKYLGLKDTIWVLILPILIIPWYVLLLRTFFQKIPKSLIESAKIDGARELRILLQIIIPLSKPALATIGLFIALGYWNDWWLSLLYINDEKLIPLQYMLHRMMANIEFLTRQIQNRPMELTLSDLPNESIRMAMMVVAAGPMLFIFPFFQKYFVRGLTVGAIKG